MRYTEEDIKKIVESVSVLDYFQHLVSQGKVNFEKKSGRDYYFRTDENKFSVNETGFYDFKTGKGGKLIKAVMSIENKSWKGALDFLKDFSNTYIPEDVAEIKRIKETKFNETNSPSIIIKIVPPNNDKLISYFNERGISKEVLETYTKQIHYQVGGKKYFGIGLENQSQGYEIRNPMMKTKIGKNDLTIINNRGKNVFVFEGMTDMLSFLQLQKLNNKENKSTLVVLNSVVNVDKFTQLYHNFRGKIYLLLDGDKAGTEATQKIIKNITNANIRDIRSDYGISEKGFNDLNNYLENRDKIIDNERNIEQSAEVSNPQSVERGETQSNDRNPNSTSQAKHSKSNKSTETIDSHNAGDGPGSSKFQRLGEQGLQPTGSVGRIQPKSDRIETPIQRKQHKGFGQNLGNRNQSQNQENGRRIVDGIGSKESSILKIVQNLKNQKPSNEQIAELANVLTEIAQDKTIHLKQGIEITDDIKNLISQYKSGGIAKEGRGILDEYYTDERLVQVVGNLIKDHFRQGLQIDVLEPSVGIGSFLPALKNLPINVNSVNTFEINETTAKISKILNPSIKVNLRPFETEFITDNGQKKDFSPKYDLVIGNPPYGQHRGLYKGLGEEPKITRYEDYFIKRSLDVLNEDGILTMIIPSGWLNRQNTLQNAELKEAYRLPNGIFKATNVGTDIIILKKNSNAEIKDISNYFDKNPKRILGEISQKTNRFGKLEDYVKGDLESALLLIEQLRSRHENQKTQQTIQLNLFDSQSIAEENILNKKQPQQTTENQSQELQKNVENTLNRLHNIKFKNPVIINEIEKYNEIYREIENTPQNFYDERIREISENLDRLNKKIKTDAENVYTIQSSPEIKKGVLKYQFHKQDEVVYAGLQNSSNLTKEELESFQQTKYDGTLFIDDEGRLEKYANYYKGQLIHDFYYAEGNIYEKLDQLEIDKVLSPEVLSNEQYETQKTKLINALPQPKALEQIIISPNHEFVHNFSLGTVKKTVWDYDTRKEMEKELPYSLADKFQDFVRNLPREAFGQSNSWEVNSFVRNEIVTGSDKERNALVRERRKEVANDLFYKFLREEIDDDLKERFVNEFNRKYNNIHIPNYKKFPLFSKIHKNFKGRPLELTEVQKAGIGRLITKGVGLLAHEVGFGKTLSGILAMHEAMERGNAKRPLIVVPNNNILKQWLETIFETIPNAKVNVLGNLGKDYDLSKFDNKDGEITLITYEGFKIIGFSKETTERLANKFTYISKNETRALQFSERDLQKELKNKEEIQGKMKRGKIYDWEDFGFDHLTFDEVHNANHIVGKVKIEDRRFSSDFRNQNQATSLLGIHTWVVAQYIQEQNNGRNITLLSATPFTNKPLEYYSILSLIANDRLEKAGFFNVNNFFETFMEADNDMEIDAKGDVKFKTNVRRFKNNSLFQQLLSEFIDIKGEEDNPELIRPKKLNREYKIEQNDLTQEQYKLLNDQFNETQKGAILTHILNARLIAISPYLSPYYIGEIPSVKEFVENSPKLNEMMNLIRQNKKDIPDSGQIIYSELAVDKFPMLKEYLTIEVGYKPEEIGIITGSTSKSQRISIQNDFNSGKVKIVIGSEAIQEGMNMQENTTDLYLLSLPYNFTSLRQTEGRAWRQGNKNEHVRVNFILTNDSIDVFMLQKLQAKQARYLEAMKEGADVLDISDISTQELKTAIITDPEVRANIEVEVMRKRLEEKITRLKSDFAFSSRKAEKYYKAIKKENEIKKSIVHYEEWAKSNDYWESPLNREKNRLEEVQRDTYKVKEELKKQGVDMDDLERKNKRIEEEINTITKEIEDLETMKTELFHKYKEEKEKQLEKRNSDDYVAQRAEENKTFYRLAEKEKKQTQAIEKLFKDNGSIPIKPKEGKTYEEVKVTEINNDIIDSLKKRSIKQITR